MKVEPYHSHHIKRRITLGVGEGEGVDTSVWPSEMAIIGSGKFVTQYPVLVIDQCDSHIIMWQTCSKEYYLVLPGKHPAILHLMREDYSYTHIHLCMVLGHYYVLYC